MACNLLFVVLAVAVAEAAPQARTAAELDAAVLDARRAIRNGSFEILHVQTSADNHRFELGVKCDFDFDRNESFRFEWEQVIPRITFAGEPLKVVSNNGKSIERIILTKQQTLTWMADEFSNGKSVAATIAPADPEDTRRKRAFDPRTVGLNVESFVGICDKKLSSIFPDDDPGLKETPVTIETVDGRQLVRAEHAFPTLTYRVWVCPDENNSIVRAELLREEGKQHYHYTMHIRNRHFKAGRVWFPAEITYTMRIDEKLIFEERVTIRNVRFNIGVSPKLFTVDGLGMRPGTAVSDFSKPGAQLEWDGTRLATPQAREK